MIRKMMVLMVVVALVTLAPAEPALASGELIKSQGYPYTPDGLCLDVGGWSTESGAPVIQWPCHGGANQRWHVYRSSTMPSGAWLIINDHSRKCMDVDGASTAAGARIIQYECTYSNADPQQQWRIYSCGFGCRHYGNQNSGLFLDVPNNSYDWGVQMIQWHFNGSAAQQFWIA